MQSILTCDFFCILHKKHKDLFLKDLIDNPMRASLKKISIKSVKNALSEISIKKSWHLMNTGPPK